MINKQRLDTELVSRGIFSGREQAKAAVMAGQIYVNSQKADKAGEQVAAGDRIEFRGDSLRYVSRGGLKLEKAIEKFGFDLSGYVCIDVGASTGGFTDCMLQNGAVRVYAVDVGYGQLAWNLRTDDRVINLERTNIRYITPEQIPEKINFVSVDVSFISLSLVLPVLKQLLAEDAVLVCLVKPQFEAGRDKVGKHGVVREPQTHFEVLKKAAHFARENGYSVEDMDFSPIKGPQGNIEYLMVLHSAEIHSDFSEEDMLRLVQMSHSTLD